MLNRRFGVSAYGYLPFAAMPPALLFATRFSSDEAITMIDVMIYALTGIVRKLDLPQVAVDVSGVSYLASVPAPLWDSLQNDEQATIIIYTLVREDRLDLFGFSTAQDRAFFMAMLNISGIGPKLALELCSIPKDMLIAAAEDEDAVILTNIKGIGRKTAEKLLVDLKSLFEKHPEWVTSRPASEKAAAYDTDAVAALASLGYDQASVLDALKRVPAKITKTEDRVAAALRSL